MGQRSVRFPDGLEERLVERARVEGRSFSNLVVVTLEKALSGDGLVAQPVKEPRGSGGASDVPSSRPASSRASKPSKPSLPPMRTARDLLSRDSAAMERQRRMNEAKGL